MKNLSKFLCLCDITPKHKHKITYWNTDYEHRFEDLKTVDPVLFNEIFSESEKDNKSDIVYKLIRFFIKNDYFAIIFPKKMPSEFMYLFCLISLEFRPDINAIFLQPKKEYHFEIPELDINYYKSQLH